MESKWCFPGTRNSLFATYTCIQALFEVKMESKIVKNSILEVNICNPMLFGCQSGVRSVQCQFVDTLSSEIKFATQFESKSKICQKSNSRHNLKRFAAPMAPKSAFTPLIIVHSLISRFTDHSSPDLIVTQKRFHKLILFRPNSFDRTRSKNKLFSIRIFEPL